MRLRVLCIGSRLPGWMQEGVDGYLQRMTRECPVEVVPLAAAPRKAGQRPADLQQADSEILLKACRNGERRIALDERGKHWDTPQLSRALADWRMDGRDVALLIGGADGHSPQLRDQVDQCWSLSALTLPHGLVRVVLVEQLYRAWSLLNGHPYHRA